MHPALKANKLIFFFKGLVKLYTVELLTTICQQLGSKDVPKSLYMDVFDDCILCIGKCLGKPMIIFQPITIFKKKAEYFANTTTNNEVKSDFEKGNKYFIY